jgi:hypothetical protein
MIIKGERLPFSMNIVADDTLPIERVGINWDEEFAFYNAGGRQRRKAREVIDSAKAKRQADKELKRLEKVADGATKREVRLKRRRNNLEISAEDELAPINMRIERAARKAQAAKDKAKELRDKATEETAKSPTSAAASAANFAAKVAERKADEQQKKAEETEKKAEKEENKIVDDLKKKLELANQNLDTYKKDFDDLQEKYYTLEEEFLKQTEEINKDNFDKKPDNPPGDDGGIPWWGWALIGTAGLGIIGTVIYFVAKKGK